MTRSNGTGKKVLRKKNSSNGMMKKRKWIKEELDKKHKRV